MRTAIVPAQITTVEDKVAGNLSITQLGLMVFPLFVSGVVYAGLPPFMAGSRLKIGMVIVSIVVGWVLAVRIKEQLVLNWIVLIGRYVLRPRIWVADKNDGYLRPVHINEFDEMPVLVSNREIAQSGQRVVRMNAHDTTAVEELLASSMKTVTFKTNRKGRLDVQILEVE